MLRGTDQSNWQKNAVTSGDFIILKATEGCDYVDPTCDAKYQLNKKAGKLLGVYHFARPDLNSAIDEARFFVENIKGYINEAILVLDWEQPGTQGNTAWAKAWLNEVERLTGVAPLIYMSASVVNAYDWSAIAKKNGLWIAGYPKKYNVPNPPTPSANDMPYGIGAWEFWAIWQYSSSAGSLDLDIANMDASAWKKYANPGSTPKPEPTPTPTPTKKTNEQLADEVIAGEWGNDEERKKKLTEAGYDYNAVQAIVNARLAPKAEYYTIQPGDNLTVIAQRFGTSVAQLLAWNSKIKNPDVIYAGDTIRVK